MVDFRFLTRIKRSVPKLQPLVCSNNSVQLLLLYFCHKPELTDPDHVRTSCRKDLSIVKKSLVPNSEYLVRPLRDGV